MAAHRHLGAPVLVSARARSTALLIVASCCVMLAAPTPADAAAASSAAPRTSVVDPMPGEPVVASGSIGVARRGLLLQVDSGPRHAWRSVARGTSGARGAYVLRWRAPLQAGAVRVRVTVQGAGARPTASRLLVVTRPTVTLAVPRSGAAGTRLAVTATTRPARAGRVVTVQLQPLSGGAWRVAGTGREGRAGRTALSVDAGPNGDLVRLRARVTVPAGLTVMSPPRIVVIDPPPAPVEPKDTSVRPVVALQPAPGPGSPPVDGLQGSDADWVRYSGQEVRRWNPCRAISYRVNVATVPAQDQATWRAVVTEALATLSRDSGLQFVALGDTDWWMPDPSFPGSSGTRPTDAALTVSVVQQATVMGYDGSTIVHTDDVGRDGTLPIVRGDIDVSTAGSRDRSTGGIDAAVARSLLLHELGHAVGLDHTVSGQVMYYAVDSEAPLQEYQRGDRAGLLALGSPGGCWLPETVR